jgi:hypothetical protein
MAIVSAFRVRAAELRSVPGMTPIRAFRILRREFPHMERDVLVNETRIQGYHRGVTPQWALWGQPLRPVQIRYKQKGGAPR